MEQRRICWPDPDRVCLEGGCGYCNDHAFRSVVSIRRWAANHDMTGSFDYGEAHRWNNAQSRVKVK